MTFEAFHCEHELCDTRDLYTFEKLRTKYTDSQMPAATFKHTISFPVFWLCMMLCESDCSLFFSCFWLCRCYVYMCSEFSVFLRHLLHSLHCIIVLCRSVVVCTKRQSNPSEATETASAQQKAPSWDFVQSSYSFFFIFIPFLPIAINFYTKEHIALAQLTWANGCLYAIRHNDIFNEFRGSNAFAHKKGLLQIFCIPMSCFFL